MGVGHADPGAGIEDQAPTTANGTIPDRVEMFRWLETKFDELRSEVRSLRLAIVEDGPHAAAVEHLRSEIQALDLAHERAIAALRQSVEKLLSATEGDEDLAPVPPSGLAGHQPTDVVYRLRQAPPRT